MAEEHVIRKLAAILYADVAGYSRLTGEDEVGTHRRLSTGLNLISDVIKGKGGKVVHYAGDAVLADFSSVVAAVDCAVGVQRQLSDANAGVPDDKCLQFRIGVNLGEVIVDRDDIYGDGVNVAARLESLAEPGGICVSSTVFEQVKGKLDVGFRDMGAQEVKNIAQPVRVYEVLFNTLPADSPHLPSPVTDKPSIAVLPYDNMSGDPEQEYFADGMTEDIITALSRFRNLFVIARNSTFSFKGRAVDVFQVAKELGVRYVLEGSVRRAGNRVRITSQLIDAATGSHIWADRFDRELDDFFTVQDEITEIIVAVIEPEIGKTELNRAARKPPENLDAWDFYQRGLAEYYLPSGVSNRTAITLFDQAIDSDPSFAAAYAMRAEAFYRLVYYDASADRDTLLPDALRCARKAIDLDAGDARGHFALARVQTMSGNTEAAITAAGRAIALNPNYAMAYYALGLAQTHGGKQEDAIASFERALNLSPNDPYASGILASMARSYVFLGEFEKALIWANRASQSSRPRFWADAVTAAACQALDRPNEARVALEEVFRRLPEFSAEYVRTVWAHKRDQAQVERFIDLLRAAGMPETSEV